MSYPIAQVPSPKYSAGRAAPVVAIVHHRMVGTLRSTDATFTTGTRQASTTFGVGYGCGKAGHVSGVHVHQYVNLDDSAWGNGNWDPTGQWNDRYPTTSINGRTVSIEHHDNGHLPAGDPKKGVVPDSVIAASIWLDALLLDGDPEAWHKAGIRWRSDANAKRIADELQRIVVGPHTIVDHHYVSGRLKPYCWRPWAGDPTGFPQQRYLDALGFDLPDSGTDDMLVYANANVFPDGPRIWRVKAGTTLNGYDPAQPGKVIRSQTFSGDSWARADAEVFVTSPVVPKGGPFLRVIDGAFAGLLIVKAQVALDPAPADPTPYDQADIDAAIAVDRGNAYVAWRP